MQSLQARSSRIANNQFVILAREFVGFLVAINAAFLLRFDFAIPSNYLPHLWFACLAMPLLKVLVFKVMGLERCSWRYFSLEDLERLLFGNFAASLLCGGVIWGLGPAGFPRSIYILDLVLATAVSAGGRATMRRFGELGRHASGTLPKRVLIYGAGSAGVILLREIRQNTALGYKLVGFVDDDPTKTGLRLSGGKILGNGSLLPELVQSLNVDEVLIAIPSATGAQMTQILSHCQNVNIKYKTVPGLAELIEQANLEPQIRPVELNDLLGRQPVQLEHQRIADQLKEQVILVSGAAGSIGSELCRQIARFHPRQVVAFDIAETGLFELERSLRAKFPEISVIPEVGSVQDRQRLDELLKRHRPKAIFHAAAFKHVPMMEKHPFEALQNNLLGTYYLATAAQAHQVDAFVLISTDKAVQPRSVMGATKRLAELVTSGLQDGKTKFVATRFGNVLGSNGSVVPIFQQQIREGGPISVTHPDMTRYFMTIPEAAQLVLQTSVMGRGGEIFVLDMGEPVRIVDLATNLILLSGLRPGIDIRIEFSGLRPGEKLSEDLHRDTESLMPTHHPRIMIYGGSRLSLSQTSELIRASLRIVREREIGAFVEFCQEYLPDYQPSSFLLDGGNRERRAAHV